MLPTRSCIPSSSRKCLTQSQSFLTTSFKSLTTHQPRGPSIYNNNSCAISATTNAPQTRIPFPLSTQTRLQSNQSPPRIRQIPQTPSTHQTTSLQPSHTSIRSFNSPTTQPRPRIPQLAPLSPKSHPLNSSTRSIFFLARSRNHARIFGLGRQINNLPVRVPVSKQDHRMLRARRFPKRFRIYRNRWLKIKLMFNSYHQSHSNIQDTLDAWNLVISPQWRATRYNAFFRIVRIPKSLFRYYEHRNVKWLNREFDEKVRREFSNFVNLLVREMPLLQRAVDRYPRRKPLLKVLAALCFLNFWLSIIDPGEFAGQEGIDYISSTSLEMVATTAQILHQHDVFHFRNAHHYNSGTMWINRAVGRGRAGSSFNTIEEQFKVGLDSFLDDLNFTELLGGSHRQFLAPYILDTLLHVLFCRSNIQFDTPTGDPYTFLNTLNTHHVRTMSPFKPWKANTPNALALTQDYNFKINFFRAYSVLRKRPTITRDLKDLYSLHGKTMEFYYDTFMEEMYHDKLLREYEMLQNLRQFVVEKAEQRGFILPPSDISSQSAIIDLSDPRHALAFSHLNYLTKGNAVAFPLFPNPIYEKHYTESDRLQRAVLPKPGQKQSGWVEAFSAVRLQYSAEMFRLFKARKVQGDIINDLHQLNNVQQGLQQLQHANASQDDNDALDTSQLRDLDQIQQFFKFQNDSIRRHPSQQSSQSDSSREPWTPSPTNNLVLFQDKVFPNQSLQSSLVDWETRIQQEHQQDPPTSGIFSFLSSITTPILSLFTPARANAGDHPPPQLTHFQATSPQYQEQQDREHELEETIDPFEKYMIYNASTSSNDTARSNQQHYYTGISGDEISTDSTKYNNSGQKNATQLISPSLFDPSFAAKTDAIASSAHQALTTTSTAQSNSVDTSTQHDTSTSQIATIEQKTFFGIPQLFPTISFSSMLPQPLVTRPGQAELGLLSSPAKTVLVTTTTTTTTTVPPPIDSQETIKLNSSPTLQYSQSTTITPIPSLASSNNLSPTYARPSYTSIESANSRPLSVSLVEREYLREKSKIATDIMTMQGIVPEMYPRKASQRNKLGLDDDLDEFSHPKLLIDRQQAQFLNTSQTIFNTTPEEGLMPITSSGIYENRSTMMQKEHRELHSVRRLSDVLGLPEHVVVQMTAMTLSELLAARSVLKAGLSEGNSIIPSHLQRSSISAVNSNVINRGVYDPYQEELNRSIRTIDMDLYAKKSASKKNSFVQQINTRAPRIPEYIIPSQYLVQHQFETMAQSEEYQQAFTQAEQCRQLEKFQSFSGDATDMMDTRVRLSGSSDRETNVARKLDTFLSNLVQIEHQAFTSSQQMEDDLKQLETEEEFVQTYLQNPQNAQDIVSSTEPQAKLANQQYASDFMTKTAQQRQQQLDLLSKSSQHSSTQSPGLPNDTPQQPPSTDKPKSKREYFAEKQNLITLLNPNNPIAYNLSQHIPQSNPPPSSTAFSDFVLDLFPFFTMFSKVQHTSTQSSISSRINAELDHQRRRYIPVVTPVRLFYQDKSKKMKQKWLQFKSLLFSLRQQLLHSSQLLSLQSLYLSPEQLLHKKQQALNYKLEQNYQIKDSLVNGVVSDVERYKYDYLSSLCARLDVCMLQIQYELKRIHNKPIYMPHSDMMAKITPIPLTDDKYRNFPKQKQFDDKNWQDWTENEDLKQQQITYV